MLVHRARSGPRNPITQSERKKKEIPSAGLQLCVYLQVRCIICNKEWHVRLMFHPVAILGSFEDIFCANMGSIAGTDVIH